MMTVFGGTVKFCHHSVNWRGYPLSFSQQEDKHCKPSRRTAWSKGDDCVFLYLCVCVCVYWCTCRWCVCWVAHQHRSTALCLQQLWWTGSNEKPAKWHTLTPDNTVLVVYIINTSDSVTVEGRWAHGFHFSTIMKWCVRRNRCMNWCWADTNKNKKFGVSLSSPTASIHPFILLCCCPLIIFISFHHNTESQMENQNTYSLTQSCTHACAVITKPENTLVSEVSNLHNIVWFYRKLGHFVSDCGLFFPPIMSLIWHDTGHL